MDNILIIKNSEYKVEKLWKEHKKDKNVDSNGDKFPYPITNKTIWSNKKDVIERLVLIHTYLDMKKKYEKYDEPKDCLICGEKDVSTKRYIYKKVIWEDGLKHYVETHNIEPTNEFKKFIFNYDNIDRLIKNKKNIGLTLNRVTKKNKEYVMIDKNQLLILDALMIHGGVTKKYINDNSMVYSEHAGLLDFEQHVLSKILVSGKTTRIDEGDSDIFMPMVMEEMLEYEYIFHTHPPTPKIGGRAKDGILYEFPSISDIYHFIDHYNDGKTLGSLVISAEGLYNIRKTDIEHKKIKIDEDKLYKKYNRTFNNIQNEAIKKYGTNFNNAKFYRNIAQNTTYIDTLNSAISEFNLIIDFYPRKQDENGNWYIDTVFLVFYDK